MNPATGLETTLPPDYSILYFDGICNLCNGLVQFVIRQNPKGTIRFASLQSEKGRYRLEATGLDSEKLSTVIFEKNGRVSTKSDAVLGLLWELGGFWKLSVLGRIIPRFLRNALYDLIARRRYSWFGKGDSCMIPTPELMERFLS
jgi:predicted DCC family thiol-disulfide oxidoreductase YuxK